MVNAPEPPAYHMWTCGPKKDSVVYTNGNSDTTMATAHQYLDHTGDPTLSTGTYNDNEYILFATRNGTQEKNEWNNQYTGPIICICTTATGIDNAMLETFIRPITALTTHVVYRFSPDLQTPIAKITVGSALRNTRQLYIDLINATPATLDSCVAINVNHPITNESVVIMGRTSGTDAEQNKWVKGLYGPVVVSGGSLDDSNRMVFTDIDPHTIIAFMAWIHTQDLLQS